MQPLINLRLLSSQLKPHESNQLIQSIGFHKIISFIFSCFLATYNQTHQHHNELSNITNIIQDIINSRNKYKPNSICNDKTHMIIHKMDALPFELIAECASYLNIKDYMNLSSCNRIIYCASNSPTRLQELNVIKYDSYEHINLSRFSMIKTLHIRLKNFNKLNMQIGQFPHLQKLHLDNDRNGPFDPSEPDVNTFINSKCISLDQITHLSLAQFGTWDDYKFESFCDLLLQFPNITHLTLDEIYLTHFEKDNNQITSQNITPKIQGLNCVNLGMQNSSNVLKNILLKMYCKQLLHLFVDFKEDMDIYSFPQLNTLLSVNANDNLSKILSSTRNLKILEMGPKSCKKSNIIQNSLIESFRTSKYISTLKFCCKNKHEIEFITETVEKLLLNSKGITRNSLKITLTMESRDTVEISDIELYIKRIMNGLDMSQIQNTMLIVNIPEEMDINKYGCKVIDKFKVTHLVARHAYIGCELTRYRIIISNKNCNINGYGECVNLN